MRGRGAWLLAAACVVCAACMESRLVPCGDQLCPVGDQCVVDRCASPEQVTACGSAPDGASCTFSGNVGLCDRGVCVPAGCGNLTIDPGETCDDGNTTSGDGCRGDCKKIEMCGDGVRDEGEACDDGNTNSADGCDACVLTVWTASVKIGGTVEASATALGAPHGLSTDRLGNLYIADTANNRIRRVDPNGVITTVVGTGLNGLNSNFVEVPATSTNLYEPYQVVVDGIGNLYLTDGIGRIRIVSPDGIIHNLAVPYGTLAVDGLGNLYIAATNKVLRRDLGGTITTVAGTGTYGFSGDGGPATSAMLAGSGGIALDDAGNLYIGDSGNYRIRRVDVATGVITTIAGNGTGGSTGDGGPALSAQLSDASELAVDGTGNVYFRDSYRIRQITTAGIIKAFAGTTSTGFSGDGGPAVNATFSSTIGGLAADHDGHVFVADTYNNRVRRVDAAATIATVAGDGRPGFSGDGGSAMSCELHFPTAIGIDAAGNMYVAGTNDYRVRKITPTGVVTTVAGTGYIGYSGDNGPALQAQFSHIQGLAVAPDGTLYISDYDNNRIRRVDPSGTITTFAGTGDATYGGDGGPATSAALNHPFVLALDATGNLFVSDLGNSRIRRISTAGTITTVVGDGIADDTGDGGPATSAEITNVWGLAVDASGRLILADRNSQRVRRVSTTGIITTIAGTGTYGYSGDGGPATSATLTDPCGLAIDAAGNLFISDNGNYVIRKIDTAGTITSYTTGSYGYDGDGGPHAAGQLLYGTGLSSDGANLFIADYDADRVRKVSSAGVLTTVAGFVDPEGSGPLATARLADPRALVIASGFSLFAGGNTGTVQAVRGDRLGVVAGRYPQDTATGVLARFRTRTFGSVGGIAYDADAGLIYITEGNRVYAITPVSLADENTWTIATLANTTGTAGFANGAAASSQFRAPTGLFLDPGTHQLYVADTGNHAVRAIDLSSGVAAATVRTIAGTPEIRGFFGDGGAATSALLFEPRAVTRCANGDVFVADTGNNRVRRIAAATNAITTIIGDGVAASSGEGRPAVTFPVDTPLGLACDELGNLFVTSRTTVRLVTADPTGTVDGSGAAETVYGAAPRDTFPASVTSCLTGLAVVDARTLQVLDSCTGLLVELVRGPK